MEDDGARACRRSFARNATIDSTCWGEWHTFCDALSSTMSVHNVALMLADRDSRVNVRQVCCLGIDARLTWEGISRGDWVGAGPR